jgi:hypothetical protein
MRISLKFAKPTKAKQFLEKAKRKVEELIEEN